MVELGEVGVLARRDAGACLATSAVSSGVSIGRLALLQREAVDVAVEEPRRVGGHRDREAAGPQAADDRVVVAQRRGPGEVRDSISPIAQGWRESDLAGEIARRRMAPPQSARRAGSSISPNTKVDHAVQQVVLVGDVVVQRHRLDPEASPSLRILQRA